MAYERHKCSTCKIRCAYRDSLLKRDRDVVCIIPMRREQALEKGEPILGLEELDINGCTKEVIDYLMTELETRKLSIGYVIRVGELLVEAKKAWCPATQKNINANVDMFDQKLKQWQDVEAKIKEMKKEQVITIVPLAQTHTENDEL